MLALNNTLKEKKGMWEGEWEEDGKGMCYFGWESLIDRTVSCYTFYRLFTICVCNLTCRTKTFMCTVLLGDLR